MALGKILVAEMRRNRSTSWAERCAFGDFAERRASDLCKLCRCGIIRSIQQASCLTLNLYVN